MGTFNFQPLNHINFDEFESNIRADYFFLVTGENECWNCGDVAEVISILAPVGHEQLEEDGTWSRVECVISLRYVDIQHEFVFNELRNRSSRYSQDVSKAADEEHLMNHCANCSEKIGDFYLHSEPGAAFFPITQSDFSTLTLKRINLPLRASAVPGENSLTEWVEEQMRQGLI